MSEKHFAVLNGLARHSLHGEPPQRWFGAVVRPYQSLALAATVTVVVVLAVLQYRPFTPLSGEIYQQIADEVATNHMKLKPLEVRSADMTKLRAFFSPLGFMLIESSLFENTPWRMTGGRFCTIRGKAAAQLRMQDAQGRVQTVYQVPYDTAAHRDLPDIMRGEVSMKLYSRGLKVQLWRERGLLFAVASE